MPPVVSLAGSAAMLTLVLVELFAVAAVVSGLVVLVVLRARLLRRRGRGRPPR